ncbi:MAG: VanZ family protein [Aeromicrobium sp.]|nr:VanZ family protein [Aeromicrobium sp.]
MRNRPVVLSLGGLYLGALLLIGLWPTHVDQKLDLAHRPPATWLVDLLGLSNAQAYDIGEFCANILLFVPLGMLIMALIPRVSWLQAVGAAGSLSILIELAQTLLRPDRTGDVRDVMANTLGAALGATLVVGRRQAAARFGSAERS